MASRAAKESLRKAALRVTHTLRNAGFPTFWVGGCVRDSLLGKEPHEIDIGTAAPPERVRGLFRKTIMVGARFGVVVVVRGPHQFQVATFRRDASYSDGRHPDSVAFADVRADVARRDFTVNGLVYDPETEEIFDWVGGRADLQQRLVRAIGEPSERFGEDHLRMLRAVRFATQLDFEIESQTWNAIKKMSGLLSRVSGERLREELERMLAETDEKKVARGLRLLYDSGLAAAMFPEAAGLPETDFEHLIRCAAGAAPTTLAVVLAALHHRCGRGGPGAEAAAAVAARLKMSREQRARLVWLSSHSDALAGARARKTSALKRLFAGREWPETAALSRGRVAAGCLDRDDLAHALRLRERLSEEEIAPEPLLSGDDLLEAGFEPGPAFGETLEAVYDAQLDGEIATRSEALTLAKRLMERKRCT